MAEENPKGSKKDILKSLITCQASDVKEALHGRRPKEFFCFVLIAASNLPLTFALFEVRVQEEKFLQCIDTSLLRFNFLYLYVLRFLGEIPLRQRSLPLQVTFAMARSFSVQAK